MQEAVKPVIVEEINKLAPVPVEAPTPEGTPTPAEGATPEPAKAEDPLSTKFAALSRREKQIQEREKAISEKEKKFKAHDLTRESVLKNPLAALESLNMTFEEFAQAAIKAGDNVPPSVEDKLRDLEEKLTAREKREQEAERERAEKEVQTVINNFKDTIKKHVASDADKYELIAANNAFDTVYEVIEAYHNEHGEILDVARAADQVENYLYEEAQRILKLKKFMPKTDQPAPETVVETTTPTATTLTNKGSANSSVTTQRHLTREESIARSAEIIRARIGKK